MPRMDRTGPLGTGPTGRGLGTCGAGLAYQRSGGWRLGRGFRRGGGFGWGPVPTTTVEEEKAILEQQKNWLATQLEEVEKLLNNLNKPEG